MTRYPTTRAEIQTVYELRRDREENPAGQFDRQKRWYPTDHEAASCCRTVRTPSAAYPYSLLVHCRTKKHLATWFDEHVQHKMTADEMKADEPEPLYLTMEQAAALAHDMQDDITRLLEQQHEERRAARELERDAANRDGIEALADQEEN